MALRVQSGGEPAGGGREWSVVVPALLILLAVLLSPLLYDVSRGLRQLLTGE